MTNGAAGPWASEVVWNSGGGASGGGVSTNGITLPSYQAGVANSANGGSTILRNSPDVAMEADFDNYYCTGGACYPDGAGTSFATPRWAGFLALVNQQASEAGTAPTGGIGFLNPPIYQIAETSEAANDFHDITSGNNLTEGQPVWYSAVAGYDLTTGWGSPTGQSLIDDLAGQQTPGFWLSSSPNVIQAAPGGTATATVHITDAGNFTGLVNLAVTSTLPGGVTASFASNSASASDVLTFTVSSDTASQNIPVTVTGTSGSLTENFNLTLSINTPSFKLSDSPAALTVTPGNNTTSTITVLPQYGFAGSVGLVVSGLPAGVTASFSPVSTAGTSILTLTASSTATGGYSSLTITGTSGNLTATSIISLFINAPTFSLQTSLTTLITGLNSSVSTYIEIYGQSGFSGNVNLTASNLPNGVTASFSPNPTSGYSYMTLTTNGVVQPGTSTITVTGTSGAITSSITLTLQVMPPSFSLSTYSTNLSVGPGSSTSTYVYVADAYGFSSSVDLYVSGLPSGVTASWSQNPVSSNSTTLYLYTSSNTPLGQYPITITGKAQGITASTTLTLTVAAPTFTMSSVGSVTLYPGSSTYIYGYIQRLEGFSGAVSLSASGLPPGVTLSFPGTPISSSLTYYEMSFQVTSAVAPGQYPITITGTSGTITQSTTFTLSIPSPSFYLGGTTSLVLNPGSSTTAAISINSSSGFTGSVNLSVSGLPTGVTGSFSPNPTSSSSTLTLTASSAAPTGQYYVTVTGTSGSQTQTLSLYLSVGSPSFSLFGSSAVTVGQGASIGTYLEVEGNYGFSGPVTLSASGMPSGMTVTFSQNPVAGSFTYGTMTIAAATTLPDGQYPITVTGTSGASTSSITFTVTVAAQSFSLTAYGGTFGQASTGSGTVFISQLNGFTGTVNLSISGLPAGVTATLSPTSTTYSSTILFTVASTASPGSYTATVTGTSGAETETAPVAITVAGPNFYLSGGTYNSLDQGGTTTGSFFVTPQYGFNGSVTLTASNLPNGVTASFSPNPTTSTSTLTVSASATATPGYFDFTVTGTSGSITNSINNSIEILASSFSLLSAPNSLSITPGSTAKSTVAIVPTNGFSSPVTLTVSGLPAGVTAVFSSPTATTGSVLTFNANASATPGSSIVTITGTSGSSVATSTVNLNITAAATQQATSTSLSFSTNGSPASAVAAGTAVSVSIGVTAGSTALTAGQVYLCPASAVVCDAVHSVATAQITSGGNGAAFNFIPGAGAHTYVAAFAGSTAFTASTSAPAPLTATSAIPTTTSLTQAGQPGNYVLTATVTGTGDLAPTGNVSFLDTNASNDTLASIALSNGASTVTQKAGQIISQPAYTGAGVTGDFNGDGLPDLAFALSNSTVTIQLGNGDGTFRSGSVLQCGFVPYTLAVGDFNGDGKSDLVAVNNTGGYVAVYLGNGDGTFASSPILVNTLPLPTQAVVADMNNDGFPDLVVLSNQGSVQVFYGNGAGAFTASNFTTYVSGATEILTADFNGDGILDLALEEYSYTGAVAILLGNSDGSFTPMPALAAPEYPSTISVGDFNQDGKPDLAVGGSVNPGGVQVYLGNGDGTFGQPITVASSVIPVMIAVSDINNDGKQDMLVEDMVNSKLVTLLGNGDGTFTTSAVSVPQQEAGFAIAGDWNGDGVLDAAVSNYYGSSLQIFLTQVTQTATATANGVSPFGAGQHLVDASYAGDAAYAASISGTVSLTATAGPPNVTVTAPSSTQTLQQVSVTVAVSAGSGYAVPTGTVVLTAGTFTSAATPLASGAATFNIPAGSLPAGTDTITVVYNPDAASNANYTTATGSGTISVSKVAPTVSWTPPAPITYATPLSSTQLDATASVPGTFSYTPAVGAVLLPGQQTLSVLFTPSDSADYSTATASVMLTVNDVASSFSVTGLPAQVDPGIAYNVTVSSLGVLGQPFPGFTGLVTLASTAPGVQINPSTYTYTSNDSGSHTFQATFPAAGTYSLTATSGSLTGSDTGIVVLDMIWLVNSNGTLSQLDSAGNTISPSNGYTGAGVAAGPLAIDGGGNIWSLSPSANAVVEYNSAGTPLSSGAGYIGAGLTSPAALAIDGAGYVFVANGNGSLSVLTNSGSPVSPTTGYASGSMNAPSGIAVDGSGRIWVSNGDNSVTEIFGTGASPVTTPTSSAVQSNTLGAQP